MQPSSRRLRLLVAPLLICLAVVAQLAGPAASQEATPATAASPNPDAIQAPPGFQVETVATGLDFPSDITFDDQGTAYVALVGDHTYGITPETAPPPRILRLNPDGSSEVIYDNMVPLDVIRANASSADMPEGLISPITGLTWNDGLLYVSHRSRVSTLDPNTGEFRTIINGLPSWGFFHNNKVIFGPDGKMYFFLSTQGNAGPIDEHWMLVINAFNKPEAHEVPCEDVELTGQNFPVPVEDPNTPGVSDQKLTGVYVPLGTETTEGQVIEGEVPCNGAFFRANPDGTGLELFAWGLRSDFGYRFSPAGRLVATQNSGNPIPPREIWLDWEPIYEVQEGAWYGWPDFYSSIPITDDRFKAKSELQHEFVMSEATRKRLLKDQDAPPEPLARLAPHSVAVGMVFGREEWGMDPENEILVAEFGTIVVAQATEDILPGYRVQKVNLETGEASDFLINTSGRPSSLSEEGEAGGLERPINLEWGPDGALYLVDFGVINVTATGMDARPGTGAIWRVTLTGEPLATPAAERQATAPDQPATEATIALRDIHFEPHELTIPADTDVTLRLENRGQLMHNFSVIMPRGELGRHPAGIDAVDDDLQPQAETAVTVNLPAGNYTFYCDMPGHLEAGMYGELRVE